MTHNLVSVVVISYNSSATILETLDSISAQTYPSIELIISDDGSSDDTVHLAELWAQTNSQRFAACHVRASQQNQGVPKNANAGIRLCRGEYLKLLAADDVLLPDCIAACVEACLENGWDNVSGKVQPFCVRNGQKQSLSGYETCPTFFQQPAGKQYVEELVDNKILSPTFFCKKALLEQMGLYDTRYRLMEDYPMYLKMSKSGVQFHFLNADLVEYRISESSISNATTGRAIHPGYHKCVRKLFYRQRLFPLLRHGKIKRALSLMRTFLCHDLVRLFGNDRKSSIVRFFLKLGNAHSGQ